ncbi:hypothetical protein A2331_03950 [Candidatus Falkowbacteria bacterium RIFOXYB2_FULL_34_18]|uniref:Uncharacterized protein n=1 Tax=Candidatus Falkowbacteria bacterium RIFOXYD2_FULL_34_120 TaxID=1798007 RepID=A0A1F5TPN8_9BACT|nr:MAG: hypothetical protein A2331_03950 [Candidatus Falkowbacteria bacterium RIFOXYB2_FULL_34_18]OGF29104.1 MAG: hypothetical protein A2500_03275 [Candidatus Falkowbacteria bacterium RIFOXYC12_FULL_34_55]OGF36187.1 MAG: hypothetical protein A2466_04805 [Candidatus Falkowbacteria bacterium RIFOXYC2_FULL_34_220]OGF38614.1 MAG: hypothetical protein A2515_02165 [Candidatus Falkowbacteria bacterium RIFOXYD12_FULL_34_57]OGF40797.1 MAG: hypothetical protein A2531_06810 [Candidatus Falkowbacteria bact
MVGNNNKNPSIKTLFKTNGALFFQIILFYNSYQNNRKNFYYKQKEGIFCSLYFHSRGTVACPPLEGKTFLDKMKIPLIELRGTRVIGLMDCNYSGSEKTGKAQ